MKERRGGYASCLPANIGEEGETVRGSAEGTYIVVMVVVVGREEKEGSCM